MRAPARGKHHVSSEALKRYGCIIIDPAWRFDDTDTRGAAEAHYKVDETNQRSTMSIEEILALPVNQLAAPDAHQFLWTTAAHNYHAHALMEQWGFTFKIAIPWIKTNDFLTVIKRDENNEPYVEHQPTEQFLDRMNDVMKELFRVGRFDNATNARKFFPKFYTPSELPTLKTTFGMGHYLRHVGEWCMFGARGKSTSPVKNIPGVIFAPRMDHSEKPAILHEIAELISPAPRLEMFARDARAGWDTWGNQAPGSIDLSPYTG